MSSSSDKRALAYHTSTGEFLGSLVIGKAYARVTGPKGSVTVPTVLPATKGWYKFPNGGRFKQKTLKSGKRAILAIDPTGKRTLLHISPSGTLYVRHANRTTEKVALNIDLSASQTVTTVPDRAALAALETFIDRPGAWKGDDDFARTEASHTGLADLKVRRRIKKSRRKVASVGRVVQDFGDYYGDYGDYGNADSGDAGDAGDAGDGDCGITLSGNFSFTCGTDFIVLTSAAVIAVGSGVLGVTSCFVAGVFTLGAACVGAIAVAAGSSGLVWAAWRSYSNDNCPMPTPDC